MTFVSLPHRFGYAALLLSTALSPSMAQTLPKNIPPAEATVEIVDRREIAEANAYLIPRLTNQASSITNFRHTVGNLQIQFAKGIACPLMVDGKPKGLYITGTGSFTYLAKDPVTWPLLRYNLQTNTKLVPKKEESGLTVGEPLTEAVLWFLGSEPPSLPAPTQPAPKEAYENTQRFFESRDSVSMPQAATLLGRLPLGQLATYQRANASDTAVFTAELVGEHEKYLYTHDPAYSRMESLFIQRPVQTNDEMKHVPLITVDYVPIGHQRKAPHDPDFQLFHMDLDMVASNKTYAKFTVVESLRMIRPKIRMLVFSMADTRAKTTVFGATKSLKFGIARVLLDGHQDLNFDQWGGYLLVDLGREFKNGDTLKLTFEMEGDLLSRVSNHDFWRLTPGEKWFPEPEMAGQSYTLKAHIAVEKPFTAIASAKTVARSETATHNVLDVRLDKPTLWFSIAAGKYQPKEMAKNGLTVRAWGYSGVGKGVEPLLKTTHAIMDFYRVLFGNIPFDEINLVEVPSYGFGQAPAGMIWLTSEAFNALGDDMNRRVASGGAVGGWVNRLVSHELAHEYWAHNLKSWGQEDQWLNEGFAEYTSALAVRAMRKKGVDVFEAIVKDWGVKAQKASHASCIPTANLLSPNYEGGDPTHRAYRQNLLYNKGAYLLACLHKELGEQAFVRFLRTYLNKYPWYPPSYNQDVPDTLKEVTGKDYGAWFDKYLWGTEMPAWKP